VYRVQGMNFYRVQGFLAMLLRQFLLFAFIVQSIGALHAQNRIATTRDQMIYGTYITPGDLIIDTPTKVRADGAELNYYFMAKQWPGLREGGTIWIDGEKLGFVRMIKLSNTSSAIEPWHVQSVRLKNIPHTQVVTEHLFVQGIRHFELDGESEQYPGLSKWPSTRKFVTGSFGFHVIGKLTGGHGISISVSDGGTIKMKGFEAQHGFSAVRINHGDHDLVIDSIDITNFYVHDTIEGEGFYIGATHKPPLARIRGLRMYNGIITRTAAEALQVQHLIGGTDISHITIRAADVRWMNAFQPGQDTGIQWSIDAGDNKLHHIIVDGFGSVGLVPFGSDIQPVGGVSEVSDILFNDGLDMGMYLHKSGAHGIHWVFERIHYANMNERPDYLRTGRPDRNYIVSAKNGTDEYTFRDIHFDRSKQKVFQDTAALNVGHSSSESARAPVYRNSGFYEAASRIRQWFPVFGKYFPASKAGKFKIPTCWDEGDIAIVTEDEYRFYLCKISHESDGVHPKESRYFTLVTWDENGIRNDRPGWSSAAKQSYFPPDDLRLEADNYWRELGYGIND